MTNFLNPRQAASLLGVCTKTLLRWEAAGLLKPHRTPGGHRRYVLAELSALLAGQSRPC
jgi:putative resolvase